MGREYSPAPMADRPSQAPANFLVVLVTVPDVDRAESIARALLEQRLAACVSRVGPLRSLFRWEGKIDAADEQLLLIKTRAELFEPLRAAVAKLHPYQVPEIVALPLAAGADSYLAWLARETGPDPAPDRSS